ncbi:MAG: hypothetical protein AAF564_00925 [Bacteroidota bacterium]
MVKAKRIDGVLERSLLLLLALILWVPASLFAQQKANEAPGNRQLNLSSSYLNARAAVNRDLPALPLDAVAGGLLQSPAAPQYDVVALRVAFQADTSRFTTGTGQFSGALFDTLRSIVDPLPHDAGYFEAHLDFLSNYVARVSDGQTTVNTHLIPEVVVVSQEMAAYSPTGLEASSDAELSKLASLVDEAWGLADAQSSFDMSQFNPATTAFVLFHAGVGRDIELVGTSLDKTPQDLPTIYFNEPSLQRLLPGNAISFNNFPVNHTILMPRTESRLGFDFIQDIPFLVEFSINGLLASSFFNFLEVPDLFDTTTGESAIGPFGLMDPLGLFAFNGLFPPEPSAWTKLYLGWADPVVVEGADAQTITLNAAGLNTPNEMARVPISASEYFLVENRNRDVANDELTMTIYQDGALVTQTVEMGQEDFNSTSIDAFVGGVVVDVDDYDWAMPGGLDVDGNRLEGGILIWHIDERLLAERLPLNQVNNDVNLRAIDLEEADGAQDIGFPSDNIFGPQAFLGTPFDFFYQDNPVVVINGAGEEIRLYTNRFGEDTYPNSNTNAGGASFVELNGFTPPGPSMSFTYGRPANPNVTPLDGFPVIEDPTMSSDAYLTAFADVSDGIVVQSRVNEVAVLSQGVADPLLIQRAVVDSPVLLPGNRLAVLGASGDAQTARLVLLENGAEREIVLPDLRVRSTRNQLIYDNRENRLYALLGNPNGASSLVSIDLDPDASFASTLLPSTDDIAIALNKRGDVVRLHEGGVTCDACGVSWRYDPANAGNVGQLVMGEDESGLVGAFTDVVGEKVVFLRADGNTSVIDLQQFAPSGATYQASALPILLDVNRDGLLEVLLTSGPNLLAFHAGGGLFEGFPIVIPAEASTQPIVANLTGGSSNWEILVAARDGYIYGYSLDEEDATQQIPGFPLAVGADIIATPLIRGNTLYAIDREGSVKAWVLENLIDIWWGEQAHNLYRTNFVDAEEVFESTSGPRPSGIFVENENYNWPNPIRNGETHFRLSPSQDVQVTITIIDSAGGLIDKLVVEEVVGGTATDIRWQTDAGSGLYYARLEALAADGAQETRLIKLAIIR